MTQETESCLFFGGGELNGPEFDHSLYTIIMKTTCNFQYPEIYTITLHTLLGIWYCNRTFSLFFSIYMKPAMELFIYLFIYFTFLFFFFFFFWGGGGLETRK